ncbi:M56 family metallopeptidase [Larkinella bovis]|uniref:M56 family metallopeptidase n=1 Tax=Larkinella bovis TaxID=683041 RepID=A0ABW0ID26_9BACT
MSLLIYLLQAGLILAVLTLCYRLLLRRATWFGLNRYLLVLNVALALLLPLVELPDFRPAPVRNLVQQTVPNLRVSDWSVLDWSRLKPAQVAPGGQQPQNRVPDEFITTEPVETPFDWPKLALWVYLAGGIFLAGRLGLQLASLTRLIMRSERSWDKGICLVTNAKIGSPFSFFRWVVLNPVLYEPDELEQILHHERVHSRQWHSLDMLSAEVLRIVFWFNPFAWWHQQLVQENLEYLVDREVLEEGVEKKAYQYYLLKASLSGQMPVRPATNPFNQHQLKNRIRMMNRSRSRGVGGLYLLFGGMVLFFCTAFNVPKTVSKYVVDGPFGVFGLITSVTTAQDLEVMQAAFADKGMTMQYRADRNRAGLIDYISVEVKRGNNVITKTSRQLPPFVLSAHQAHPSQPFVVETTQQPMLLPDTLYALWEREKPVVVLNGRLLKMRPGQPFGFGTRPDFKRSSLTAQEAIRRFGPAGKYGATTLDGKIVDAIFSVKPPVLALGRRLWEQQPLTVSQQQDVTFLIDGLPGTYAQFRQLAPTEKLAVAVFDRDQIGMIKPLFKTEVLVVVTTKRQLLAQ